MVRWGACAAARRLPILCAADSLGMARHLPMAPVGLPARQDSEAADAVRGGPAQQGSTVPDAVRGSLRNIARPLPMADGAACAPSLGTCRWSAGQPAREDSEAADGVRVGPAQPGSIAPEAVRGSLRTMARHLPMAFGAACAPSLGS